MLALACLVPTGLQIQKEKDSRIEHCTTFLFGSQWGHCAHATVSVKKALMEICESIVKVKKYAILLCRIIYKSIDEALIFYLTRIHTILTCMVSNKFCAAYALHFTCPSMTECKVESAKCCPGAGGSYLCINIKDVCSHRHQILTLIFIVQL